MEELLLGFIFFLVLSDNLLPSFTFFKEVKNIYIVLLAIFFISGFRYFAPAPRIFRIFLPFFLIAVIPLFMSPPDWAAGIQKTLSYALLFLVVPGWLLQVYRNGGDVSQFLPEVVNLSLAK